MMKKKAILLAMATFLLAACSNKGGVSSSTSEGSLEEVVELMTECSKLGSFRDGIVEDAFDAAGDRNYDKMSQEERAKFAAEYDKKYADAKAQSETRGKEIEQRLSQLEKELADKSINTEPDLNVPLEVVKPFHITKLTPDRATIECTVKVLIDRVIKDESIRSSHLNNDYCVSAYAEDESGNGIVNEFRLSSEQIDNYRNDLAAGTEVTLTFTTHPGFNQEIILTAHKIVLLWPAPIDDIDDEMGAEEGSEMD